MSNTGTTAQRPGLSEAQQALLRKRLQHAREATVGPQDSSSGIPRHGSRENIPLSYAQQRLWFIDQLEPNSPAYNMCEAIQLSGALNVPALERSLNEIIRRHEILRTNFIAVDGNPIQVVIERRLLSLAVRDCVKADAAESAVRVERMIEEEASRPFDLRSDLLLRVLLIRRGTDDHVFMFTMHHIISDGWSLGVFFEELKIIYAAEATMQRHGLPELPVQYADFVMWERERLNGPVLARQLEYWKNQLRGRLPVLELPTDHPHPVASSSPAATKTVPLPPELARQVKALSQREGATLFMTLLAAFQVLLHRYTGEDDIVTGSVVAGRSQVALEKLVGFFVNTLVLRGNLAGDPTFREVLARAQETTLEALANQDLPFARLVEELRPERTPSRNPLFNVMFVLQNMPPKPAHLPGLTLQPHPVDSVTAKFDLTLFMEETADGLRAIAEYNADIFESETITRLLGHFQMLLEGIVKNPDQKISDLPLLTAGERQQLLVDWTRTETPYPRDRTIAALFEEQVQKTPDAIALLCAGRKLTYRELDERAGRLANRLRRCGVGPDVMVGVCVERSLEMIISLVAIIKAGGAYVSLDPTCPVERLGFMFVQCKAPVLLTAGKQETCVRALVEVAQSADSSLKPAVLRVDTILSSRYGKDDRVPEEDDGGAELRPLTPDSLAYVSYTSGSTGTPKGVCVPHRGVVRLVRNTNFARFESTDVFMQLAPVAFDASTLEIWAPLLNGGRLVVFPPGMPSLSALGEFIHTNGITVLWLTTGLFNQLAEEHLGYLKNLRLLITGGEVVSVPMAARTLQQLPRTQLINGYGPTENTTFTTCHLVTTPFSENHSVPIGRPLANTQVYVLDAQRRPVPIGVPGELYTGGDGLARGYLNQPALTTEKFVTQSFAGRPEVRLYRTGDRVRWLADGTVEFLGRIDRQVKIRGYRVEPAEIESLLLIHPAVKNCTVAVGKDPAGGKRLVACIVLKPDAPSAPVEWGDYLRRSLPDYMVPSVFAVLDTLPLSSTGKVDHAALLVTVGEQLEQAKSRTPPRDAIERQLAELWEAVLGVSPIGVHDRFFDLGGHSLLAVRLLAKVETVFGRKLPVSAVFQQPTVAQLATLLRSQDAGKILPTTSIVHIQPQGSRPPVYFVHGVGGGMFWGYANIARHLGPEQPVHAFKSRGLDGLPELSSIDEMARTYVADLKQFQPEGPYVLGGYCFGGNVAYEMARQLQEQGDEVALLVLISASPPNSEYESTRFRWSLPWMFKFTRNTGFWLNSFIRRWDPKDRRDFVRWKARLLGRRIGGLLGIRVKELRREDVDSILDLSVVGAEQRRLWDGHMRALANHRPQPYDGKTVLIRSSGHLFLCSFDEQCGWGEFIPGGVSVKRIPGDHGRVLAEPFVAAAANELRRALQEHFSQRDQTVPAHSGGRT